MVGDSTCIMRDQHTGIIGTEGTAILTGTTSLAVGGQQLQGFLGHLVDDTLEVRPVVAEAGGTALHLVRV